ncbi:hypothetical protein KKF45_05380 [Patescibacteria group bacterium]|nr:hypothetical protein [Patescibacteria group bacterium]
MAEKEKHPIEKLLEDLAPAPPPNPPLPRIFLVKPKESSEAAKGLASAGGAMGTIYDSLEKVRKLLVGER